MTALLETYLQDLRERNLCESTIRCRKYLLKPFIEWLGDRTPTRNLALKFLEGSKSLRNCASTYNVVVHALNSFLDYIHPKFDKDGKLPVKRLKPELPEYLTREEMGLLINAPSDDHFKRRKVWDRLFVLLAVTAMRISEATALTWHNIAHNDGQYWIHIRNGKTGDRTILLPRCCYGVFDLKNGQPLVFTNRFGGRISANGANEELQRRAKAVGIQKNVHCHLFRHGALTYYASKGKTTHELAALSGHTKSSTLDKYVHLSGFDTKWVEDYSASPFT